MVWTLDKIVHLFKSMGLVLRRNIPGPVEAVPVASEAWFAADLGLELALMEALGLNEGAKGLGLNS